MRGNNTTSRIKIQAVNYELNSAERKAVARVEIQGAHYAVYRFSRRVSMSGIKKLSKDEYMVCSTGEIRPYKPRNEDKGIDTLKRTFARLRGLIRANFEGGPNELFITLTYAQNMTDYVQLYDDFKNFMKRLKYVYPAHGFEYIAVAEPQERGAWHMHVMLKSTAKDILYIDYKDLSKIWVGRDENLRGYVDVQRLKSDELGSYYVAYFTDLISEGKGGKKRKKGARLHMYPVGMKFYRCSRGIRKPVEVKMTKEEVESLYGEPVYQKTVLVTDEDGNEVNLHNMAVFKFLGEKKNDLKNSLVGAVRDEMSYQLNGMVSELTQAVTEAVEDCFDYKLTQYL
jgi:hypothetical protein